MACGTWPIVYADTACAEVVEQGTGQIVTGDIRELEQAIRAYKEKGVLEQIESSAEIFSMKRFGLEVIEAYEEN